MTFFKSILEQLNFVKQCRKYDLSLWQCPNFLFLILGLVIITSVIGAYYIAVLYDSDPTLAALMVLILAAILFVIGSAIISSFNNLAEANKTKSEFISIASHQLRTPLTNIKWVLDLLIKDQEAGLTSDQLENLRMIKENDQRMIDLVNDLLISSRVSQDQLKLVPEKVDLVQVIRDILNNYQSYARANNVSLKSDISENLPQITVDRQKIELVLEKLIDNGIRYGQSNGWVEVRLFPKKKKIRCEVEDNGVGIPKIDQVKIFNKFFRGSNVVRYQTEGTGLGLFIIKSIIKNSKGRVGFSSKEDKGSLFWFELPIN